MRFDEVRLNGVMDWCIPAGYCVVIIIKQTNILLPCIMAIDISDSSIFNLMY